MDGEHSRQAAGMQAGRQVVEQPSWQAGRQVKKGNGSEMSRV